MRKKALLASLTGAMVLIGGLVGVAVPANAGARNVVIWSSFNGTGLDLWNAAVARVQAANPGIQITSVGSIDMAKSLAAINAGTGMETAPAPLVTAIFTRPSPSVTTTGAIDGAWLIATVNDFPCCAESGTDIEGA